MLLAAIQTFDGFPRSRCHCLGNLRDVCASHPERLIRAGRSLNGDRSWVFDVKPGLRSERPGSWLWRTGLFADAVGINRYQNRRMTPGWEFALEDLEVEGEPPPFLWA